MKKIIIFSITLVFICIISIFFLYINFENDKNILNKSELFYTTYEYECETSKTDCKAYFFNSLENIYITSYKYNNKIDYFSKNFNYENFKFDNSHKIILPDKTILTKKLNFVYDVNLNGTYNYNNYIYTFKDGSIKTTIMIDHGKPHSSVIQMDKDIIYIADDIISEISVYKYKFNENKDLILIPIASSSTHLKERISYTLKRQN